MKKALILLGVLFTCFNALKAQTCSSPLNLNNSNRWTDLDSFNVAERYYKFLADSPAYTIKVYMKGFTSNKLTCDVFAANCSSLTSVGPSIKMFQDSIAYPNDTNGVSTGLSPYFSSKDTLVIRAENLTRGNYYLVRLTNITGGSYIVYRLNATAVGNPNIALIGCNPIGGYYCGYTYNCGELVCNGDFECINNPPGNNGGITFGFANNWTGANDGSADLLSSTASIYWSSTPCNGAGQQAGHNGSRSYAGIGIYGNNPAFPFTEYIQTKLSAPMLANIPYVISFYVSKADRSTLRVDQLSIFTSTSQIYQPNQSNVAGSATSLTITPAATISNTTLLNDMTNWQRVSFCFTPTVSGLQFLAIGSATHSQSGVTTVTSAVTCTNPSFHNMVAGWAYLYIDDVSVKAMINGINNITQTVCAGTPIQYNAMPCTSYDPYSFSWSPGTGLSSSGSPNPTITISSSQTYSATMTFTTSSGQTCSSGNTIALVVNTTCCSTTLTPFSGTVLPLGALAGSKFINNDVSVPTNQSSTFVSANIIFGPGVKVIVNQGATLYLRNSHLYGCGAQMWQGIVVNNGGRIVTTVQDNLIEDAITAIDLTNLSNAGSANAIDITNTTFNKNFIDISIKNYTTTGIANVAKIRNCVFTCRSLTFTSNAWPSTSTVSPGLRTAVNSTTGLTPPYTLQAATVATLKNPYAGRSSSIAILVDNVGATTNFSMTPVFYALKIGDPSAVGIFNLFDSHCYFIHSTNANIYSYNNVFQNTLTHTGAAPNGPRPPLATVQGGQAIYAQVTGGAGYDPNLNTVLSLNPSSNSARELANRFWNCHVGVKSVNTFSINSTFAIYRSTQSNATTINNYVAGNTGISASTNRFNKYDISNVNFNNINNPINITINPGTYVLNNSNTVLSGIYAGDMIIAGNYFGATLNNTTSIGTSYLNKAVLISSAIGNTWTSVGNNGLYIANNAIDRAYNGISLNGLKSITSQVVSNTITLVDENVVLLDQRGIAVLNCTSTAVANNGVSAANLTNQRVALVHCGFSSAPSVRCNTLSTAYRGFLFEASNQGTFWKGNDMSSLKHGLVFKATGIIGTQGGSGSPSDNKWSGSWTGNSGTFMENSTASLSPLYVKTAAPWTPTLNTGNTTSSDYYTNANAIFTTTGTYSCSSGTGSGWPTPSPGNLIVPNVSDYDNMNHYYSNCFAFYRYLHTNDSVRDNTPSFSGFYSALSGSSMQKFLAAENYFYKGNLTSALSSNNSVTDTDPMPASCKSLYALYAAYADSSFNSSDSTNLAALAQDCPFNQGGVCIYQARALYSSLYGGIETYIDGGCSVGPRPAGNSEENEAETRMEQAIAKWTVDLFPNPAQHQLKLVSKHNDEDLSITITDINGRILVQKNLKTEAFIANLDLDLATGVYFINIKNSADEKVTKKLVISQ